MSQTGIDLALVGDASHDTERDAHRLSQPENMDLSEAGWNELGAMDISDYDFSSLLGETDAIMHTNVGPDTWTPTISDHISTNASPDFSMSPTRNSPLTNAPMCSSRASSSDTSMASTSPSTALALSESLPDMSTFLDNWPSLMKLVDASTGIAPTTPINTTKTAIPSSTAVPQASSSRMETFGASKFLSPLPNTTSIPDWTTPPYSMSRSPYPRRNHESIPKTPCPAHMHLRAISAPGDASLMTRKPHLGSPFRYQTRSRGKSAQASKRPKDLP